MPPFLKDLDFHILVVEDEPELHEVIAAALRYDGHRPTFTTRKATALTLISSLKLDLVIADMGLPDGLGTEVVQRAAAVGIPSIVMSGNPSLMAHLDTKRVSYLCKPFRFEQFRQEVRNALRPAGAA